MKILPGDFSDPRVISLLQEHLEGMRASSPPESVHALDLSGLQTPDITFWVVWDGKTVLGCGALKETSPDHGEIKSMRTATAHLRKGVGAAMLDHILAEARARGYKRISLETGSGAAFEPALTLYRKYSFSNGSAFGGYEATAFNQFLHLKLNK